jgi:hypothetical protein
MVLRLGSQSRFLRFILSTSKATVYVLDPAYHNTDCFDLFALAPNVEGVSLPVKIACSLLRTTRTIHALSLHL